MKSSTRGLTSAAAARHAAMGASQARTWKQSKLLKLLPLALEAAAALAMVVGLAWGGGHEAGDASIAALITALIAADFITRFAEWSRAEGDAAAALLARLAPPSRRTWVRRDGVWSEQDAAALVPGDVIRVGPRDTVPADALLVVVEVDTDYSPQAIRIDQSALTGDPAPAAKFPGDDLYAGSACAHGEAEAVVVAAGAKTHLQQAVLAAINIDKLDSWIASAFWNVCVVAVCFNELVQVVAGHQYASGEIGAVVVIACFLAGAGWLLSKLESMSLADHRRRPPERDPEDLMRSLEVLWQNGSISEETLRRCHDLFGIEPVSDELVATLAEHFGWQATPHEE